MYKIYKDNKELVAQVVKAQWWDIDSRNKLIEYFYPMIKRRAKSFNTLSEDLVGYWVLRLLAAIEKFDESKSYWRFTSYAWSYIINWMHTYQWKYNWPITMPVLTNADISAYNKICQKYFDTYWIEPLDEEIRSMSWWWREKFEYISNLVSWDYSYNDNDSLPVDWSFLIKPMSDVVTDKITYDAILEYASSLPKIEAEIFKLRNIEWKTLRAISIKYWFTTERVRQLSEQALFKIRRGLWNMRSEPQT